MKYKTGKDKIIISIPAKSKGRFRFKKRSNNLEFGESFAARSENFTEDVYLEWQISYDTTVSDVKNGKKKTNLTDNTFIGDNGKEKYLYELSELLYEAVKLEIISINDIENLLEEVTDYEEFIDDKKIKVDKLSEIVFNGITFKETAIRLPTLFMIETEDQTQVEISIQKQQYAAGVQPMLYFTIPLTTFSNYEYLIGKSSKKGDMLNYIIDCQNANVLFDILKIFAMCSERHNFDIIEIIKILIKKAK